MPSIGHYIKSAFAICDAERCSMVHSAVAFWSVGVCLAVGCRNSDHNVKKYQVESSSMAPTWFGTHLSATCSKCGQQSLVVDEAYDAAIPTRCFSCGAVCLPPTGVKPGEMIEVTRCSEKTPLRRFDVVTFGDSKNEQAVSPNTLKRVWALPGERIELLGGEAWIDGKLLQKTPKELAAVSIPISRFPRDTFSHWWIVDDSSNEATSIETAAGESPLNLEADQRLEFRYARPNRLLEQPAMLPSRIVDDFPFNQNSIAPFHEVPDFLLAFELDESAMAPWTICLRSEEKLYCVQIVSEGVADDAAKVNSVVAAGSNRMLIAICDGRLLVATEQKVKEWRLVDFEANWVTGAAKQDSLISITTTEALRLKRLLVARDQWLGPRESRLTDWVPNGTEAEIREEVAGGYFVLGDNLQLSLDSRDASMGRIARDRIRGHVKRQKSSPTWILSLLNHSFRDVGTAK